MPENVTVNVKFEGRMKLGLRLSVLPDCKSDKVKSNVAAFVPDMDHVDGTLKTPLS